MSRRRSLVGALLRGPQQVLLFLPILTLLLPAHALAKRSSQTSKASLKATASSKAKPSTGMPSARTARKSRLGAKAPAKQVASSRRHGGRKALRARRVVRAKSSRARARALAAADREPAAGSRGTIDEHVHVRRGETLDHILTTQGVSPGLAARWLEAAQDVYDLRYVRPRRGVTLRFDRATRALESVRYEIDDDELLVLEREGDDVVARREALPYFRELRGIAGRIERGLREDTTAMGVPATVAASIADIFGWDLDVESGLESGAEFRVIYENLWEVGRPTPLTGQVIAAEIKTQGRRFTAVLFEDEQGATYYRPDGQAISRTFLRYPVEFTEITSGFSMYRMHPILHRGRPHLGVDLAAPMGTPVRATAAGWVSQAGWNGGLGQSVRVEHPNEVSTTYGHLTEIVPSVREGAMVERGQVIGFVGSTGLATGPHLHYEFEQAGAHVDPMAISMPYDPPVADSVRRTFERVRNAVTTQLARLPLTDESVGVSLSQNALRGE